MTITLVGIALIASASISHGESETLSALAARAGNAHTQEAGPGLKPFAPATKGRRAQAAQQARPPTPVLAPVRTRGTGVRAEGIAAGAVGAVGNTQFVQLANGQLAIFNKADGALLLGPVQASLLFAGLAGSPCSSSQAGQALVQFDQMANRWLIAYQAGRQQCIAVSSGDDAGGRYQRYALALDGDDLRIAIWPDAYYLTLGLFDDASGAWRGPRVCGLDRAALLAGVPPALHCHDLGNAYGPLTPVGLDGYHFAPEGNQAATLLSLDFTQAGEGERLLMWRYSFSRNSIGAPVAIPVAPFTIACPDTLGGACIEQPSPGAPLVALGDRLMPRAALRMDEGIETLGVNHTVQHGGTTGIRWYELRAGQLYQQGTHAPDQDSRWMGSMAIDKVGNIALGYQVAGRGTPPGIRFTGRQRTDPHGRMQGEEFVINGTGVQIDPATRWRQQGAMSLDPVDGCTFWYTQQYIGVSGRATWRSRIVSFQFQNCR
ncbi:MAG: hypothetical protein V4633_01540 [Pseudomonadota bacterium]